MKSKTIFLKLWPILYIMSIWFIFASPYFIKGFVPYASKYQVNFFPPWSHYEKFLGPVKNNAMPDIHTQIFPWKKLTIDTYKSGQFPLWNPYSFSGNPHLANFQTAVLSPLNILFFILPFVDAWSVLILLQPLLAGIFIYFLMRQYKLRRLPSLLSATCFMFCGFLVVWMAYGTLGYAILYLPLSLLCIEKFIESKKNRFVVFFALTIPLSFFSGHFQISFYLLIFLLSYLVWAQLREKASKTHLLWIGFIAGVLLSTPQLIPTIQLYLHSVRSESYITGGGIPIRYFITTISPDFYGNPVTRNDWFGFYAEWASFVGVIPFFFALVAMFMRKNRAVVFYTLATLFILLLSLESFVQPFLGSLKIPVISTSAPSRIIVLYSFCMSVLAGFGLHYILERDKVKTIIPILLIGIVIGMVWFSLFFITPFPEDKILIAKRNFVLPTVLFIVTIVVVFLGKQFSKKMLMIGVFILFLLSSFDSFRFVQKWMPFDPRDLVYPDIAVISAIKKHIGYGRMFGNFGGETAVYYGIPSIEGYDPLYIGRYGEFLRASSEGSLLQAERSVAKIARHGTYIDKMLDILGVSLIFHPIADTNASWAYPVWKDTDRYKLVYQDDRFHLYQNTQALPRAYLYYTYSIEEDDQKILTNLLVSTDIKKRLILEENPGIKQSNEGSGLASITVYTPTKIIIEVNSSQEGLLFLSDNYYPGWEVTVNNIQEKILRADYTFRAVKIPSGKSIVEFSYHIL